MGSARSVWPHWICPRSQRVCFPSLHCPGSRLLCWELSEVGPGLHALPRSKLFRFSGSPQRRRLCWACILCLSQVRAAQVTRCLVSTDPPQVGGCLIASPIPAAWFSGCTTGALSQVCRVSLLVAEVLVSKEACLQFGRGCLSEAAIAPFRLWLPLPACLQQGMGQSAAS